MRLLGMGDYTIAGKMPETNSLFTNGKFEFTKRPFRIQNREYIMDIVSGSSANSFNYNTFDLNPGSSVTFPWLNRIAQNFESYRFHGLVFEFKSMSADALNSTNTALG